MSQQRNTSRLEAGMTRRGGKPGTNSDAERVPVKEELLGLFEECRDILDGHADVAKKDQLEKVKAAFKVDRNLTLTDDERGAMQAFHLLLYAVVLLFKVNNESTDKDKKTPEKLTRELNNIWRWQKPDKEHVQLQEMAYGFLEMTYDIDRLFPETSQYRDDLLENIVVYFPENSPYRGDLSTLPWTRKMLKAARDVEKANEKGPHKRRRWVGTSIRAQSGSRSGSRTPARK